MLSRQNLASVETVATIGWSVVVVYVSLLLFDHICAYGSLFLDAIPRSHMEMEVLLEEQRVNQFLS